MRKTITPNPPIILSTLALSSVLLLAACEPERLIPPKPIIDAGASSTSGTMGPAADASVPRVDNVFSPTQDLPKTAATSTSASAANTAATATASTRSNSKMSRAEEFTAMPIAGQNNDHSAPAAASSPGRAATGTSSSASTRAKP